MKAARPLVGIIMGSQSDFKVMAEAAKVLADFDVTFEIRIVSAHRTPERMFEYAREAVDRGLQVLIAGAGGAAHLPGMVASLTSLPVVGVPVRHGKMEGLDALLSIAQMPKGVPVATMAVDNAANAGLFAVRILAINNKSLQSKLSAFGRRQKAKVRADDKLLRVSLKRRKK